jgi:shikimate dehydrogenase
MTAPVRITGATRLYAIVGDPIVQVRSAEVFTQRFAQAGFDAVLVPAQVSLDKFETIIPALMALGNLDGLLVTAPLKATMARYASRLGETAACIGAVNALRREADGSWTGDIFDGAGFVRGIERKGERLHGRRVLMFGAGGAGSAIACALAAAGVRSIRIVSPDPARGASLSAAVRAAFPDCDIAMASASRDDIDMVVNASPVGMRPGDGLPGDIGLLTAATLVGDVVVSAAPTALIQQAIEHGCHWVNGHDMHAGQIDAILAFFAPRLSGGRIGG